MVRVGFAALLVDRSQTSLRVGCERVQGHMVYQPLRALPVFLAGRPLTSLQVPRPDSMTLHRLDSGRPGPIQGRRWPAKHPQAERLRPEVRLVLARTSSPRYMYQRWSRYHPWGNLVTNGVCSTHGSSHTVRLYRCASLCCTAHQPLSWTRTLQDCKRNTLASRLAS